MAGNGRPAGQPGQCTCGKRIPSFTRAGRRGAAVTVLANFDPGLVDMHTLVVAGSSRTRVQGGRMVTPRDYLWAPGARP
jgi:precorrin-3B methylase